MKKNNSQLINSILIILGGALLILEISGGEKNVYVLIVGIILLMFGLYRATNHWVETKDDHLEENKETSEDENF